MRAPDLPLSSHFPWDAAADAWAKLAAAGAIECSKGGRWYEARAEDGELAAALRPPLILLDGRGLPEPACFAARAARGPGDYALLLFRAGAAAVGRYADGELLDHKAFKRYVVRGKGRAQSTHLQMRGKSRYGSRLRLRNEERLLAEVAERLARWWGSEAAPERLYAACPAPLYARLSRTDPPPPFGTDDPRWVRLPLHVHEPKHAELLRVHASIARGRLWSRGPLD